MVGPEEKRWKPIVIPNDSEDTTIDPCEYIYTSYDTDFADSHPNIFKKQANGSLFRGVDRLKLIANIIAARKNNGGCHLDVYKLIKLGNLMAFFPLHDYVELRALESQWIRILQFPWRQRVDAVKDYYGEKIGKLQLQ